MSQAPPNLIEEIEKIKKFLSDAQSKQMTTERDPLHNKSDHGVDNNYNVDESSDNNGLFWADVVFVNDDNSTTTDINKNTVYDEQTSGEKHSRRKLSMKRNFWLQDNLVSNNSSQLHSNVRVTNL